VTGQFDDALEQEGVGCRQERTRPVLIL
jgi:hypothetical protein